MKAQHLHEIFAKLQVEGYDKEVPATILKQHLIHYVGIDKYKLKYTLEILVELGYFSWAGMSNLRINNGNDKK